MSLGSVLLVLLVSLSVCAFLSAVIKTKTGNDLLNTLPPHVTDRNQRLITFHHIIEMSVTGAKIRPV